MKYNNTLIIIEMLLITAGVFFILLGYMWTGIIGLIITLLLMLFSFVNSILFTKRKREKSYSYNMDNVHRFRIRD